MKTSGIYNPEIIVVDNGSTDETSGYLKELKGNIKLITNKENVCYSKANNQGAEKASGKYLVFLNNDTKPFDGWLDAFKYEFDNNSQIAVQGAKLLYKNMTIQHAGVIFGKRSGSQEAPYHAYLGVKQDAPYVNRKRNVQFVTGACMAFRKDVFEKLGGFDEEYEFGWEDTDLCIRARLNGYEILYNPEAVLYHYESVTKKLRQERGDDIMDASSMEKKNRDRFFSKWQDKVLRDAETFYAEDGFQIRGSKLMKVEGAAKENISNDKTIKAELITSLSPKFWNRDYGKAETVLFKLPSAIGDSLTITAVAADLKRQYPHLTIYVSGDKYVLDLFQHHPFITRLFISNTKESQLQESIVDIVIDYNWIVSHLVDYYNGLSYMDILGNVAGFKFGNRGIIYIISDKEKAKAKLYFDNIPDDSQLIGIHFTTNKDSKRCYPFGSKLVLELYKANPELRFLHFGINGLGLQHDSIIDCALMDISLRDQIAMASHCNAFLTIDSAFFHIGYNLFNKPTMAIFGATNPELIGNFAAGFEYIRNESLDCLNCYWQKKCEIECMRKLMPETIARAFIKMLRI